MGAGRRPDRRDAAGAVAGFESGLRLGGGGAARRRPDDGRRQVGCIVEIKRGARSSPSRGAGVDPAPRCRRTRRADALDVRLPRPAGASSDRSCCGAGRRSSVAGGTFDLGSATYDMTRIVTGQLDAYVEPGPRMIDEVARGREEFERVGRGSILNNSPYDLAAAALILDEAGAVLTDATRAAPRRRARCSAPGTSSRCRACARPTPSCTRRSSARSTPGSSGSRAAGPR